MANIKNVSSLVVLVLACFFNAVSPTNLCSSNGICCKHRDSHCVAQRINANHTVDTSELPCYCDHACVHLEDCCADYKQFCGVSDCRISEWGPWSPCSTRCGIGFQERKRIILHQPINGGSKCPHLTQSKQCRGVACYQDELDNLDNPKTTGLDHQYFVTEPAQDEFREVEDVAQDESETRNKSLILDDNKEFQSSEQHNQLNRIKNHGEDVKSCMEMVIIKSSKGCIHHDHRLHIGTRICIKCTDYGPLSPLVASRELSCIDLTQTPIRRFRIHQHCHGKLTFLAKDANQDCSCSQGLHYELI